MSDKRTLRGFACALLLSNSILLLGCQQESTTFDNISVLSVPSRGLLISTLTTDPSTGPGVVTLFNSHGSLSRIVRDFFSSSEFATGLVLGTGNRVYIAIEGSDRVEELNLVTNVSTQFASGFLAGSPLRQMTRSSDGSIFVVESATNTIEKIDASGARAGGPLIPTTVGACVLATPYGITYIPTSDRIAVISSAAAGRLSIYDSNGACIGHITGAPFSTGTPTGIAYHALSDKLLVTFSGSHAIYSFDTNGGTATQIFLNSAIVNAPRAIAVDADGYIYVGSNGTDTIEKLFYDGTGVATRALAGPLIGPSIYTQNPTSILVLP
ncbi:MAG: hypothetical protein V4692_00965 [Bdellovibrionota bacterium]